MPKSNPKRSLSVITDTVGYAPKPDLEDFERAAREIELLEAKEIGEPPSPEEQLAKAKRRITSNGARTQNLLEEVRQLRVELDESISI